MSQLTQPVRSPLSELLSSPQVGAEGIEVARGSVIFRQGNPAESLYFIHHGQVRLYQVGANGEERLIEILGAGQWFGCAALTADGTYVTQAVAATQAQLSKIPANRLMELVTLSPQAAAEMIRHLASSVQSAREEAGRMVFQDCNQRLIAAMLRFSETVAATQQGENTVLHLTHEQLAQAVGAARETISLALTEMRHRNIVRTGRNRLIFNRDALRQFGNGQANGNGNATAHEVQMA